MIEGSGLSGLAVTLHTVLPVLPVLPTKSITCAYGCSPSRPTGAENRTGSFKINFLTQKFQVSSGRCTCSFQRVAEFATINLNARGPVFYTHFQQYALFVLIPLGRAPRLTVLGGF